MKAKNVTRPCPVPFFALPNTHLVLACVLVSALMGIQNLHTEAATIAYWRFEEGPANAAASGTGTILDSSGNDLNGTPINGPVYSANVPVDPIPQTGASNNLSMDFDGSSQRIFIPDNPLFQLTQSLTIEAYVNVQSGGQILFRGDDRGGLDPYYLAVFNSGGPQIVFSINNASNQAAVVETPLPALNQWVFIAATLDDATGAMQLYVNGALENSITTAIRPFGPLEPGDNPGLGIGNVQSSNYDEYFGGQIDEVRLSDQALSPSQFLDAAAVPEPSALALFGVGSIGLIGYSIRRRYKER